MDRSTFTDTPTFGDRTGQFAGFSGTGADDGRARKVVKCIQTGCNQDESSGYVVIRATADLTVSAAASRG